MTTMLRHVVRTCPRRYNNIAALRRPSLIGWQAAAAGQRLRGHVPRDLTGRRLLSARPLDGRDGGGADGAVGAFSVRGPCRSVFLRFRVAELLLCPGASLSGRRAVCGVAGPARQCVARRASRMGTAAGGMADRCCPLWTRSSSQPTWPREFCVLDGPAVAGRSPQHGVGVSRGRGDYELGLCIADVAVAAGGTGGSPRVPARAGRLRRGPRACGRAGGDECAWWLGCFSAVSGNVVGRPQSAGVGARTRWDHQHDQPRVRPRG